ncbi:MAG: 6-bladed beta-propeller [Candidatus Aminicenantes bacterium]|nr:6-bladed beta-propeller [Candidatus Aminicenantes bacterium]
MLRWTIKRQLLLWFLGCYFFLFFFKFSNLFAENNERKENNFQNTQEIISKNSNNSIKIRFIKDLLIKPDENSEKTAFHFPGGVEADSKGNIYVLDPYNFRVQIFTSRGDYLKTIGRRGQGPGEFELPLYINIDTLDNIYVFDMLRKTWVVFTSGGIFYKNIRADKNIIRVEKICIDSNQNIICGYVPIEGNFEVYKISRFDEKFNLLEDLYEKEGVLSFMRLQGGINIIPHRYTPKIIWTMGDDGIIYVSFNKTYEIEVLSGNGELIHKITRKIQPEKITQKEKNEVIGKLRQRFSNDIIKQIDFPKMKPPIWHLYIVDNYLYVQKKILRKKNKFLFDMFEKTGRYVDEVILDFQPMVYKNNFIYTIRPDFENLTADVIRYKIEKNS